LHKLYAILSIPVYSDAELDQILDRIEMVKVKKEREGSDANDGVSTTGNSDRLFKLIKE